MAGLRADVVVNENIDSWLATEPQLQVAQAILRATHNNTLFVPLGFDIYLRVVHEGEFHYFGRIDHSQPIHYPLVLTHDFQPGAIPGDNFTALFASDLLSSDGERVMKKLAHNLGQLNLGDLVGLNFGHVRQDKSHRMKIVFECPPKPDIKIRPQQLFFLEELP